MIAQISELTVKDFDTKICEMPYIIDGHNLIPKIPGINLSDLDDENQLIGLLQEFCRRSRKAVELYFDNAPINGVRVRSFAFLTVRFVRSGSTADKAIHNRLKKLGRSARNWTVVSSDQEVQSSARAAQAQVLSSESFACLLLQTIDETIQDTGESHDVDLNPEELDDWLKLFGAEGEEH